MVIALVAVVNTHTTRTVMRSLGFTSPELLGCVSYELRRELEWFKINLTLKKSHTSHKWEHKIDLFEEIYKV